MHAGRDSHLLAVAIADTEPIADAGANPDAGPDRSADAGAYADPGPDADAIPHPHGRSSLELGHRGALAALVTAATAHGTDAGMLG